MMMAHKDTVAAEMCLGQRSREGQPTSTPLFAQGCTACYGEDAG
jgi:hypothetical protein